MPPPVAKLKASDTPDVMRTDDGIDTIIRQAIGREPYFYIPRPSETPEQLIQFIHALDQQQGVTNIYSGYPGWPLLYPLKAPSDKCEKCSQEFCSTINYRRHSPVHHRFRKLDQDTSKTRDLLGAYWDKLSVEEAKEVLSFENVMLEEVTGSSIVNALMSLTQKQGYFLLSPCYMRAGGALLDIVQSKPSSFPIPSQELFSILDDASERTFLLGTTESMQKHVFHGGAEKIGLLPKNVVACTSFLLEQILVKAWLADKDAEALRCQKQLVEEEEAAQKRQAEILERKRQKKLRQKEQRAREQRHKLEEETKGNVDSTLKTLSPTEKSLDTDGFEAQNPEEFANNTPSHVPFQCPDVNEGKVEDTQSGLALGSDQIIGQSERGLDRPCREVARWPELPKSPQCTVVSGLHTNKNPLISKPEVTQKHGTHTDQRDGSKVNAGKAWNRTPKSETDSTILKTIGKVGDTESGLAFGSDQIIGQSEHGLDRPCRSVERWPELPKSPQRTIVSDLHTNKKPLISKPEVTQKHGTHTDQRDCSKVNAGKAWNRTPKSETDSTILKTIGKVGDAESGLAFGSDQIIGQSEHGLARPCRSVERWPELPKSPQCTVVSDLHTNKKPLISKPEVTQKHGTHTDQRDGSKVNAGKTWNRTPKSETDSTILKTIGKVGDTESGLAFGSDQIIGQSEHGLDRPCRSVERWPELPKSPQRTVVSDLHTNKNPLISKPEVVQKNGIHNDKREDTIVNAGKAWHRMVLKSTEKTEPDTVMNHNVLIGSISVNLGMSDQSEGDAVASQEDCSAESASDGSNAGVEKKIYVDPGTFQFSIEAAKAFLSQRWEEALLSNHVKLVINLDSQPSGSQEVQDLKAAA